jgi:hypothetical protein
MVFIPHPQRDSMLLQERFDSLEDGGRHTGGHFGFGSGSRHSQGGESGRIVPRTEAKDRVFAGRPDYRSEGRTSQGSPGMATA